MRHLIRKAIFGMIKRNRTGIEIISLYRLRHYFENIGWLKSRIVGLPVDKNGYPLPWFTYSAIYFLEKKVNLNMKVFEYGSGNSTLWWSVRVTEVKACEHDIEWYNIMKNKIPPNVEYLFCELVDGGYAEVIKKYQKKFDIVVIDGRDRVNCIKNSLGALTNSGIVILDNSERDAYQEGIRFLKHNGFKCIDFKGLGPINNYCWCTSIFYRNDNCFKI